MHSYNNYWRLYYWFKGAPAERPGGPWWFRDFPTAEQRDEYLDGFKVCLYKYAIVPLPLPTTTKLDPREVCPPPDVDIFMESTTPGVQGWVKEEKMRYLIG